MRDLIKLNTLSGTQNNGRYLRPFLFDEILNGGFRCRGGRLDFLLEPATDGYPAPADQYQSGYDGSVVRQDVSQCHGLLSCVDGAAMMPLFCRMRI